MSLIEETIEIFNTNSVAIDFQQNNLFRSSTYLLDNILPNRITIKFASLLENFENLKEIEEKLKINTRAMRKSIEK